MSQQYVITTDIKGQRNTLKPESYAHTCVSYKQSAHWRRCSMEYQTWDTKNKRKLFTECSAGFVVSFVKCDLGRGKKKPNHGWQPAQSDEQRDGRATEQMGNVRTPLILSTLTSESARGNSHPAGSDSGPEKPVTSDRIESEASCASPLRFSIREVLYIESGRTGRES